MEDFSSTFSKFLYMGWFFGVYDTLPYLIIGDDYIKLCRLIFVLFQGILWHEPSYNPFIVLFDIYGNYNNFVEARGAQGVSTYSSHGLVRRRIFPTLGDRDPGSMGYTL